MMIEDKNWKTEEEQSEGKCWCMLGMAVIQQHPHIENSTHWSWSIHRPLCLVVMSRKSLPLIKCKMKTLAQVCLASSKSSVIA